MLAPKSALWGGLGSGWRGSKTRVSRTRLDAAVARFSDLPQHAAINAERGAGRAGSLFRAEIDDHVRDLIGRREASEQRRGPHRLQEILLGLILGDALGFGIRLHPVRQGFGGL